MYHNGKKGFFGLGRTCEKGARLRKAASKVKREKERKENEEKRKIDLTAVCRFSDPCLRLMTHSANS